MHFIPYLPIEESATTAPLPDTSRVSIPAGEECEPIGATGAPWAREADIEERFTAVQQLDEHPFAYRDNLIYVLSTDLFTCTEILQALSERRYLSEDELTSTRREIEDIWITDVRSEKMYGIFEDHVYKKPVWQDMKNCIKTL